MSIGVTWATGPAWTTAGAAHWCTDTGAIGTRSATGRWAAVSIGVTWATGPAWTTAGAEERCRLGATHKYVSLCPRQTAGSNIPVEAGCQMCDALCTQHRVEGAVCGSGAQRRRLILGELMIGDHLGEVIEHRLLAGNVLSSRECGACHTKFVGKQVGECRRCGARVRGRCGISCGTQGSMGRVFCSRKGARGNAEVGGNRGIKCLAPCRIGHVAVLRRRRGCRGGVQAARGCGRRSTRCTGCGLCEDRRRNCPGTDCCGDCAKSEHAPCLGPCHCHLLRAGIDTHCTYLDVLIVDPADENLLRDL